MLNMTKEREHRFPSRPFILQIALNELVYEQGENNSTSALHVWLEKCYICLYNIQMNSFDWNVKIHLKLNSYN